MESGFKLWSNGRYVVETFREDQWLWVLADGRVALFTDDSTAAAKLWEEESPASDNLWVAQVRVPARDYGGGHRHVFLRAGVGLLPFSETYEGCDSVHPGRGRIYRAAEVARTTQWFITRLAEGASSPGRAR